VTKKRRRKRPSAPAKAAQASPSATEAPQREEEPKAAPPEDSSQRGWAGGRPSPYPPLGVTLARGLRAVGGSAGTLAAVFLAVLVTWIAFLAVGEESNPRFMVAELAVPPVNIFLTDISTMFGFAGSAVAMLALLGGLGVLRAVTLAAALLMVDRTLRGSNASFPDLARRFPGLFVTLFAVYLVEVTAALVIQQVTTAFIGPQFYFLGVVAALYFFVMVPVVAAAEDAPVRLAFRRGLRASRLPGTRHLALVMAYVLLLLTILVIMSGPALAPATPSFATWILVLLAAFVHVGVLAGFHFRWLAVREEVLGGEPADARPTRRSSAGRGRRP
jgi:hypothetical protein